MIKQFIIKNGCSDINVGNFESVNVISKLSKNGVYSLENQLAGFLKFNLVKKKYNNVPDF